MKNVITAFSILYTIFLSPFSFAENDLKKEIIDRCRAQMNQYGAVMVKACVDQDIEAVNALSKYPNEYKPIISRCLGQMREYGFMMVKACTDQDIEAEKALSKY